MVQKKRKISVLGTGNVGATIAYTLMLSDICSEILLVDINKEKAEGEALDLTQCRASVPSKTIRCGEYEDVAGSDVVIVTFGVGRKPGQTRLDLAKINLGILKSVMPNVAKIAPDALYIIVSNPVDLMTYETIKCTGLSVNQVIGTGTLLDSNRLSEAIANYCGVSVSNVNSFVLGEHGDACMAPYSLATICGYPVKEYCKKFLNAKEEELDQNLADIYAGMVAAGSKVIKAKGATFYAIAASTVQLVKALFSDDKTILPLSTLLNGEYGAKDMCFGVPCMVGAGGFERVVELPLSQEESKAMAECIAKFDATYEALELRK
ncbi:MAG: L-lactate dehydrogenase [Clostridia bacterium]|nr:L-lactate dehydrogenase [Clostridia bacterium]